ncbi:MerR family transcriptional regulator [Microbacterium resistens]
MRISELAQRTGLAPSAIRYYEQQDMFSPGQIARHPNGYRDYGPAAVRRIELIAAGRAAGFSLAQMRTRMRDWDTMGRAQRAALLDEQLRVLDERIAELTRGRDAVRGALRELAVAPDEPENSAAQRG